MKTVVASHSWDAAAEQIRASLEAVLAAAPRSGAAASGSTPAGAVRARVSPVGPGTGAGLDPAPVASTRKGARKVASAG